MRKKFTVYEPNYVPGVSRYKTVYSWYQANKLVRKWGPGSQFSVQRLTRHKDGSISFWGVEDVYMYGGEYAM